MEHVRADNGTSITETTLDHKEGWVEHVTADAYYNPGGVRNTSSLRRAILLLQ